MKKFLKIFAVVLLIALVYLRIEIYPQLDLISGFSAKSVASGHFIDNRSLETIQQGDNDIDKIDWATNKLDDKQKFVTSSVYGLKTRKAIYREGLGATLINDDYLVILPEIKINRNYEEKYGINSGSDYTIHYDLINYTSKWCDCESITDCKFLLQQLEREKRLFLGEFVKAMLKINNISTEMEKIAELTGNIAFLSKLKEIPQLTLKYVVTNQSLYV